MPDLETPEPPAEPVPDPPAPEAPPDPVEAEPEGTTEVAGQKHVPLGTLIAERREKQALKQKADQFDQLAGYVNQVRPYIDFLQANPGLITQTRQETNPTPVTTTQPVDEDALELARTLDLYTAEGQPDVKRAQKVQKIIDRAAGTQAQEAVKPLQESTLRERAGYNYQRALITKAPDGREVDRGTLDAIWARTDPKILATEEGAAGVVAMALGLSVMQGTSKAAPPAPAPLNPPLHTEPAGSRTTQRAPLSQLDQAIAKIRGLDEKTYAERTKGFTPGRQSVLED